MQEVKTLETLVSALGQQVGTLAEKMNLQSDAIIINQGEENSYQEYEYRGNHIRGYSFAERGVGLSRNNALLRGRADILLFSDEDIVSMAELCSICFKNSFMDKEKYNLGGVSYWTINRLFRTNWYTLRALYDVNR